MTCGGVPSCRVDAASATEGTVQVSQSLMQGVGGVDHGRCQLGQHPPLSHYLDGDQGAVLEKKILHKITHCKLYSVDSLYRCGDQIDAVQDLLLFLVSYWFFYYSL